MRRLCIFNTIVQLVLFMSIDMRGQNNCFVFGSDIWRRPVYVDDYRYDVDSLDQGVLRVNYLFSVTVDTLRDLAVEQNMVLEIGRNIGRFCSSVYMSLDSVLQRSKNPLYSSSVEIAEKIQYSPAIYSQFFQNYPQKGKLTCTNRICNTDFMYEENLPSIEWKILDSVKMVFGYHAQMAKCNFRGRGYTAWFTHEIPTTIGPWKFSGLPGLILKVEDDKGHYIFEATGIYNVQTPIEIPEYLYLKTTKEKCAEALRLWITERFKAAMLYLKGQEMRPTDGVPLKEKMMYDFIEISYE